MPPSGGIITVALKAKEIKRACYLFVALLFLSLVDTGVAIDAANRGAEN